jgi:transcriptional regulator with XRE-family HTH domain
MVNSADFAKRLQRILDYYDLSAAAFSDAIDVGRSSISHILSGRNKPSLDFVLKIVQTYPEVELYWLLNGKGNFPATAKQEGTKESLPLPVMQSPPEREKKPGKDSELIPKTGKTIKKIVIFYYDGSFEAFEN